MTRSISENLKRYFADIRDFPVLEREEEIELVRRCQDGCADSLNRLIESNLRFAAKVVSEYHDTRIAFDDLIGEANLGLIEAAKRFDPERGVRFISYAVWWIRRSILKALRDQAYTVRVPESQSRRTKEVRAAARKLTAELGRTPSAAEVAETLPERLSGMDPIDHHGIHLYDVDAPIEGEHGESIGDLLEETDRPSAEEELLEREALDNVLRLLLRLDERERKVMCWRFGLDGAEPLTLREVARRIGRSREAVRVIENKVCRKMEKKLTYDVYAIRPAATFPTSKAS